MIFLWIIVAILIFSIIILTHEYGHFKASRIFGVKVEEFWLGIPPKAKKLFTDNKWTNYTLNWLPLWGFVRLKWENISNLKNKKDSDALINKPSWQQSIIILAWVFMNFLLAIIIFSTLFFFWVKPIWINTKIETNLDVKLIPTYSQAVKSWLLIKNPGIILYPVKDSIAEKSWIKEGDILIKAPYLPSGAFPQREKEKITTGKIIKIIKESSWKKLIFTIKRNNKIVEIPIIPSPLGGGQGKGQIWSYVWENIKINKDFEYKYWFFESIKYWSLETYNQSILTFKAIWILAKKIFNPETKKERQDAISQMKWPIGMVDFISHSISAWLIFLIILWAIISINLWVFNLLPIPALDWWRFIFIIINSIILFIFWRKALNEKNENIINLIFFIVLIALSLLIAYNDVNHIINR